MLKRLLLGPQRPIKNLGEKVAAAGFPAGPVGVISAGWQEAEGYIDDVQELISQPLVEIGLYRGAEQVFAADSELHRAHQERQDELKDLQRLYRLRLRQLNVAARQLGRSSFDPALVAIEQQHAIAQLRELDQHHLRRIEEIHAAYNSRIRGSDSAVLAEQSAAIHKALAGFETVLITGGNVVVLMNRMRLFGVEKLLADKNIIAWSAGAMVLADLIVLFHDKTSMEKRDPEVFSHGAGVLPGYVFLPDAKRRLRKNDAQRMSIFRRRFDPAESITLDSGSCLQFEDTHCITAENTQRLTGKGRLGKVRAA